MRDWLLPFFSAEQVKQMDAKRSITFFMEIRQTSDETTRTDTVNNHGTLPRTERNQKHPGSCGALWSFTCFS
jgi:hypothetical protein